MLRLRFSSLLKKVTICISGNMLNCFLIKKHGDLSNKFKNASLCACTPNNGVSPPFLCLQFHQLLPSSMQNPEKIGEDPDNPLSADGNILMEYCRLPLQPKHMSSNSAHAV
jgi:hypothetical protein